jgi:hypothetical protein
MILLSILYKKKKKLKSEELFHRTRRMIIKLINCSVPNISLRIATQTAARFEISRTAAWFCCYPCVSQSSINKRETTTVILSLADQSPATLSLVWKEPYRPPSCASTVITINVYKNRYPAPKIRYALQVRRYS